MKYHRRKFLHLAASAVALLALLRTAWAQSYPTRPVRMIVGFAAGSGLDIYARLIAQWLSERLGQSFVIENRLGAGGNVAAETVVNAPPDGYTILMASTAVFTNPWLYDNLSFNFIRDIAPVGSVTKSAFIIVTDPSFPPKTIPELIAYAKANPGKVAFGSAGTGTVTHIAGELFKMMAGIDMVHVPYRGEPPALNDLMGGRIQLNVGTLAGSGEFIRVGKLRALAVTTRNALTCSPMCRPSPSSCPAMKQACGTASAHRGRQHLRSSPSSTSH